MTTAMEHFTDTSLDPYDRHHYRVWLRDGSYKDVEAYDDAQRIWYASKSKPKTIDVIQAKGHRSTKGFS